MAVTLVEVTMSPFVNQGEISSWLHQVMGPVLLQSSASHSPQTYDHIQPGAYFLILLGPVPSLEANKPPSPHDGGKTDNSIVNTLLPGGGKMAEGALAPLQARCCRRPRIPAMVLLPASAENSDGSFSCVCRQGQPRRSPLPARGPCRRSSVADPSEFAMTLFPAWHELGS